MRNSWLLIVLLLLCSSVNGQVVVGGKVLNAEGKPVAGCNVCYRLTGGDSPWTCQTTDAAGKYTFKINMAPASRLLIRATHLSFEQYERTISTPADLQGVLNLSDIVLTAAQTNLHTITINAIGKSRIRKTGDVVEFIPGKALQAPQLKAISIIRALPEVYVLEDDIQSRGNSIRHIYLHSSDTSAGVLINQAKLLLFQAKEIGRVTIDYNASEMHVYLKARKSPGYAITADAQMTLGKMLFGAVTPVFKLQGKTSGLQLFMDGGTDNRKPVAASAFNSNRDGTSQRFKNDATYKSEKQYAGYYLIFEKTLSKTTVLGIQQDLNAERNTYTGNALSSGIAENINSNTNDKSRFLLLTNNIYLSQSIDSGKVTVDVSSGFTTTRSSLNNLNQYSFSNGDGNQATHQQSNPNLYFGKVEISSRELKNWGMKFRAEFSQLSNPVNTIYQYHQPDAAAVDSTFSNRISQLQMRYNLSANNVFRNGNILSYALELVTYNYKNKGNDKVMQNIFKAARLLPSVSYAIATKANNYLTLFYNTNFRSPYAGSFAFNNDSKDGLSDKTSNADIRPYTSEQLGISYPLVKELTTTFYWMHTRDKVMHYSLFDQSDYIGDRLINLKLANEWTLSTAYNKSFGDNIYATINGVLQFQKWDNKGREYPFDISFFSGIINTGCFYTNAKGLSLSAEFYLISGQKINDMVRLKPYGQLDIGGAIPLGKRMTFSLKWGDVLGMNKFSLRAVDGIFTSRSVNDMMNICAGLSFSFEKNYADRKAKSKTSLDDTRKFIINKN